MTDTQAFDLARVIALLAVKRDWVKSSTVCRHLGFLTKAGGPNIRYVADLRSEAQGKIISRRRDGGGYKLMRYATQQEYDHWQSMLTKTIEVLQEATQEGIREHNHWKKFRESPKQAVMEL